MRIVVDASPAGKERRTGTEFYTLYLLQALARLDEKNQYTLLLNDSMPEEFQGLPANFETRLLPQRWLWAQTRLPWELRRLPHDVFFAPANVIPFVAPPVCVTTIHDVAFHYFPECYSPFVRWYLDLTTRFALRRAVKVIAVSQATKDDLVSVYNADPSGVEVVHSGALDAGGESPSEGEIAASLERLGITAPYLLFLGRLETKKNVRRIVEAFFQLKERGIPHQLVLGGTPGVGFSGVQRLIEGSPYAGHVVLPGYVGAEKAHLYAGADVFVFPSLYEGFGFPILEAAGYGTPVLTSHSSSLAEVAGDAALLVDPLDVDQIAQGIHRLIQDQELRSRNVQRGLERVRQFDWEKTAARVLEILEEAARQGPR
jgi:glycosyltransferase involved in cell wall biosynthesis